MNMKSKYRQIRLWLLILMIPLFFSGKTVIPVATELSFFMTVIPLNSPSGGFLHSIQVSLLRTAEPFPFLFYGYDWLAFAYFILAILFIGHIQYPVKNKWVIQFGMIACVLIIPFAMVAGYFRGIPIGWRLIDCSFGILGLLPLVICYQKKMFEFLIKMTT